MLDSIIVVVLLTLVVLAFKRHTEKKIKAVFRRAITTAGQHGVPVAFAQDTASDLALMYDVKDSLLEQDPAWRARAMDEQFAHAIVVLHYNSAHHPEETDIERILALYQIEHQQAARLAQALA